MLTVLAGMTREQVEHRRWAIPDRNQLTHLPYIASTQEPDRAPRMLAQLDRATVAADALSAAGSGPDLATRVSAPSAPSVLHGPLRSRAQMLRPPHPAEPPRQHLPPSA